MPKEAIFRALSEQLDQTNLEKAETALKQKGKIGDTPEMSYFAYRLLEAFEYRMVELFALVCNSVHGDELTDINGKVAADVFVTSQDKFIEMLTKTLLEAEAITTNH